jgi:linoleoyl-CoA desaturase
VLYSLTYFFWIFWQDFRKYFTGKVGTVKYKKMSTKDHVVFWMTKVTYIGVFFIIPFNFVGVANTLIGYSTASLICGLVIAVVFQLAHVVDEANFPAIAPEDTKTKIEDEWAVHQIKTTANFATGNKIVSWYTGGLNHQIEHHLFPRISHVHYPAIAKLVKETCQQFNIQYVEFPTVGSALKSHIVHLRKVGQAA